MRKYLILMGLFLLSMVAVMGCSNTKSGGNGNADVNPNEVAYTKIFVSLDPSPGFEPSIYKVGFNADNRCVTRDDIELNTDRSTFEAGRLFYIYYKNGEEASSPDYHEHIAEMISEFTDESLIVNRERVFPFTKFDPACDLDSFSDWAREGTEEEWQALIEKAKLKGGLNPEFFKERTVEEWMQIRQEMIDNK